MDATSTARRSGSLPALAGGTPVRSAMLPFARVVVDAAAEADAIAVLRSGWLSQGPVTARFERTFADYVGAPEAIAVSSCTAGLHLLLRAAGIGAGDEVIVPAMTFPATANAVLHAGARPVAADVEPASLLLDPASLERARTARTRAVVAVHFAGTPCDMDGLRSACGDAPIVLLEDAAHAIGASVRGRRAGTLGDGASFSFYATKNLTTGDGGMVTTAHEDWSAQMRLERLHGIDVDASRRIGSEYRHWESVALGFKYNMTDMEAALGLAQMPHLDEMLERRRALVRRYRETLATCDAVELLDVPEGTQSAAHLMVLRLRPDVLTIDRDTMLRALLAENVAVGVHFRALPCHRFFRDTCGMQPQDAPVAMDASDRVFSLPLDAALEDGEQDEVLEALHRIVTYYRA